MATPTTLTNLPRELRLPILLDSLGPEISPATIPPFAPQARSLLQLCRCIREDMHWVLRNWSPVYIFPSPDTLRAFQSSLRTYREHIDPTYTPLVHTVSLPLFHEARISTFHRTTCRYHAEFDLAHEWCDGSLGDLPHSVRAIQIDITPAPGWMRDKHPHWVHDFIQDKRVARGFLAEQYDAPQDMVTCLEWHFKKGVEIRFTGLMSAQSAWVVHDAIESHAADRIQVQFACEVLPVVPARKRPNIEREVLAHARKHAPVRWARVGNQYRPLSPRSEREKKWAWFYGRSFSDDTRALWVHACSADEKWAKVQLKRFVYFIGGDVEGNLCFDPAPSRERALLHRIAQDCGLVSESVGEEPERYVSVCRPRYRDIEQTLTELKMQ